MTAAQKTPIETFRKRLRQKGLVRVELHVQKDDAALMRNVANALGNPLIAAETRSLLKARFSKASHQGLKDLLASAPLDGIEFERSRDMGREVDL